MPKAKNDKAIKKPRRLDIDLPANLSYRRRFEITDGLMSAERVLGGETVAGDILIYDHGQRTTKSHDATKGNGDTQRSGEDANNLVNGQKARLPNGFDTLVVKTHIRVLPVSAKPESCSSDFWRQALTASIESACTTEHIREMARCYAYNLVNASWLWRNRDVADVIEVSVRYGDQTLLIPDALDLSLRPVLPNGAIGEDPHVSCREIDALADVIELALTGKSRSLRLDVTARAKMMPGQSVWPSQRYTPNKRVIGKQSNGKDIHSGRDFLMTGGVPVIGMEKIGCALRTFDRDHAHAVFTDAIIPFEPNGGSLELGINLRKAGNDLRSLLPSFIGLDRETGAAAPSMLPDKDIRYIIGCIIRGGVYGASREEPSVAASSAASAADTVSAGG